MHDDQLSRLEAADSELRRRLTEELATRRRSAQNMAKICVLLAEIKSSFERKDPAAQLLGFQTYRDFSHARLLDFFAQAGLHKRNGYYLAEIAQALLPQVGEPALVELGVEKCKALSKYVRHKGALPATMLEMARTSPVDDVWKAVQLGIYQGNNSHEEPMDQLSVVGPQSQIAAIHAFLEELKAMCGTESEAELIEAGLFALKEERRLQEEQERAKISGLPANEEVPLAEDCET